MIKHSFGSISNYNCDYLFTPYNKNIFGFISALFESNLNISILPSDFQSDSFSITDNIAGFVDIINSEPLNF